MSQKYNRGLPSQYGAVRNSKYVDINGRLVTVVEEEDTGEIYVSLAELKKSGFELFEAGRLPKIGGYLKQMTEQQINEFNYYMRIKAAKYLNRTVSMLSKGQIEATIQQQVDYYKLGENGNRTVSYSNRGNLNITTKVNPPSNDFEHETSQPNHTRDISNRSYNNNRSANIGRDNTSSNENYLHNSSHESVGSPTNSRNSSIKEEHNHSGMNHLGAVKRDNNRPRQYNSPKTAVSPSSSHNSTNRGAPRPVYSQTKQEIRSNSTNYARPDPISASSPSRPQNSEPLPPVASSEVRQNNTHQNNFTNSDFENSSTLVSSSPIPSPASNRIPAANKYKRKCAIDTISQGGLFDYLSTVDKNTIIAFVVPLCYLDEYTLLNDITTECQMNVNFAPTVGDMIAVFHDQEEIYVRGIVINIVNNNYNCSLVDYGTIITTTNIRPLPDKFKEIPEFSCSVTGSMEDIEEIIKGGNKFEMNITSPGKLTLTIEETGKSYEVQAKIWEFLNIKKENPAVVQVFKVGETKNVLKSGDFVMIISHVDGSLVLRTKECAKNLSEVNRAIQDHRAEAVVTPVVDQLVLCPYTDDDGSLHRAEVLSVDGQYANIRYVDYGDSARVRISDFKTVNETLANISNTYIAITLHEFDNKNFTERQLSFLEDRCSCREKFKAVSQAGAPRVFDLLSTDETSLSKKLVELEKPPVVQPAQVAASVIPKQALRAPAQEPPIVPPAIVAKAIIPKQETTKIVQDLPICHFETGLNAAMCTFSGDLMEGCVAFALHKDDVMDRFMTEIPTLISDHAPQDREPYRPAHMEWCLATCDGEWFRGIVLDIADDEDYNIMFVDFGNSSIVKYTDIRKITDKLASFPACSAVCFLEGILPKGSFEVPDQLLAKLKEHIVDYNTYDINVINFESPLYHITIPSIYDKLKKEGVL